MKYTIVIDKQSRTSPSVEKREYPFEVGDELRRKDNISDEIIILNNKASLIRKIGMTEYFVTYILNTPITTDLGIAKLLLFEGNNYIYVKDEFNNILNAEYIIKNEFTDTYVTDLQMSAAINLSSDAINLEVKKKLNKEEFSTQLLVDYESVKIAWNKVTEFIQFVNAQLQIKDSNKKLLMAIDKTGQHFYKDDGNEIGKIGLISQNNKNLLSFSLNTKNTNDGMAWGLTAPDGKFYPIFEMLSFNFPTAGEYSGYLQMIGTLDMQENKIKLLDVNLYSQPGNTVIFENVNGFSLRHSNGDEILYADDRGFDFLNFMQGFINTSNKKVISFFNNSLLNIDYLYAREGHFENIPTSSVINSFDGSETSLHVFFKNGTALFLYANSSDKRLKKNIKNSKTNSINKIKKIKHRSFDWKSNNNHVETGYISQEMEKIDKNFINKTEIKKEDGTIDYNYQINILYVLAETTSALQQLIKKDEEKDILIQNLIKRIEKMEASK